MKLLLCGSLIAFMTMLDPAAGQTSVLLTLAVSTVPRSLLGSWRVGEPYNTGQVIGIGDAEEGKLKAKAILYTTNYVQICEKRLTLLKTVKSKVLTGDEFESNFDLPPKAIGLQGPKITEVYVEHLPSDTACGLPDFPGAHVFMDDRSHAAIEIEGDYFPLVKVKTVGSLSPRPQ